LNQLKAAICTRTALLSCFALKKAHQPYPSCSFLSSTQFPKSFCHLLQVSRAVLKEIEEINQQLIDTVLDISDEETDSTTVGPDGGGIIIKCSFIAVSISPNFNSKEDFDQIVGL